MRILAALLVAASAFQQPTIYVASRRARAVVMTNAEVPWHVKTANAWKRARSPARIDESRAASSSHRQLGEALGSSRAGFRVRTLGRTLTSRISPRSTLGRGVAATRRPCDMPTSGGEICCRDLRPGRDSARALPTSGRKSASAIHAPAATPSVRHGDVGRKTCCCDLRPGCDSIRDSRRRAENLLP